MFLSPKSIAPAHLRSIRGHHTSHEVPMNTQITPLHTFTSAVARSGDHVDGPQPAPCTIFRVVQITGRPKTIGGDTRPGPAFVVGLAGQLFRGGLGIELHAFVLVVFVPVRAGVVAAATVFRGTPDHVVAGRADLQLRVLVVNLGVQQMRVPSIFLIDFSCSMDKSSSEKDKSITPLTEDDDACK